MKIGTFTILLIGIALFPHLGRSADYGDVSQSPSGRYVIFYNHSGKTVPLPISWSAADSSGNPISGQDFVMIGNGGSYPVNVFAKQGTPVTVSGWCLTQSAPAAAFYGYLTYSFTTPAIGYCHGDPYDGCYDCTFNDDQDRRCRSGVGCTSCASASAGMPTWSVSEPYISLWLNDEPLGYQPTIGSRISFDISFKQRESLAGMDPSIFSVGKKWNCSWLSYIDGLTNVLFPGGGLKSMVNQTDYVSNARLSGSQTTGFTISYPDGSKDVYGFIVTNQLGTFLKAFLSERWNVQQQKTSLYYSAYANTAPVVRLISVVDGDGRSNQIYYLTSNGYSTNLISQVVDAFGRTNRLAYDNNGHLTNSIDVQGISSSFNYDGNDWITSLTTPYGTTGFTINDTDPAYLAPQGRSILVTQPDGGHELYLYSELVNRMYSYPSSAVPDTSPFPNTFDNVQMNARNSFYWGPKQYANLSTTSIGSFTTNDFLKARMKHWLGNWSGVGYTAGQTVSMERDPSPDAGGSVEGKKTWYDYDGKSAPYSEGSQSQPLFVAQILPDGTTRFTRTLRNSIGAVTNAVSTYSMTSGSTVLLRTNIFIYDPSGIDLVATTNALGVLVSSNIYNTSHEILTNFDAIGQKTVYTYDASNRIVTTVSPTGLTTTNAYGSDGFLVQQIVVGFSTNTFTYTNGLVYTHTDERGLTTTSTWDNLQRLRRLDYPDGTYISNTYQALSLVRTIDRLGFTNSYGYDSMQRKTAATNASGNYTLYNYCTCGSLDSIQDAVGNFTYFYRDNLSRATNIVYADGYGIRNQFNLIGQIINVTDSSGASITNWFNNQGFQVAVSNAFGRVQTVAFDILDRATNSVDVNNVKVSTFYDNLNRPIARVYPDGGAETFGYTLNIPRLTRYTNQLLHATLYEYDAANRKISETNANFEVTRFGYSGPGDLLTLTDGKNKTTSWNYDQFGRATNKVDAVGNAIFKYSYDPDDRLTNRWTPVTSNTVYCYDSIGSLTAVKYQRRTNTFAYDALNRLTNMIDAVGVTRFSYDAVGQILSEDGPWDSDTVSYTYQNRLRTALTLLAPNASPEAQNYGYDVARRLTNVTSQAGSFSYLLGGAGTASPLVRKLLLPGGSYITNFYDSNARVLGTYLRNSSDLNLDTEDYVYNVGNQRTQAAFTAGNYMNYAYDNIGQLKTASGREPGGTTNRMQEQFGYFYDAAGNLNYRTNNTLLQTFSVNSLNELTTITNAGRLTVAGATTSPATNVTINGSNTILYVDATFASTNQPWVNGNNTYAAIAKDSRGRVDTSIVTVDIETANAVVYDLNGNLLTNGTRVFEYDDENQLTRITQPGAWKSEFTYDGKMRRRIRKEYTWNGTWAQTNEVHYVYDGNLVIQERDGNNSPQVTYTRGNDLSGSLQGAGGIGGLLARTDLGLSISGSSFTTTLYHADGNGSITCLIYTNQTVAAKYEYDPYGNILSQIGALSDVNLYRWSSKEYHMGSGLNYYLYRYYEPSLHRWLNEDPVEEVGGFNLFSFVRNDPLEFVDVYGLETGDEYWIDWIKNHPNRNTAADPLRRRTLSLGCVGLTCLNLGTPYTPFMSNCFKERAKAEARQQEMVRNHACEGKDCNRTPAEPHLFSIHLWNDKGKDGKSPDVTFDSSTGRANLQNWDRSGRPPGAWKLGGGGGYNFDYGYVNNDGLIDHANHYDNPPDYPMTVYHSSPDEWARSYADFNTEVWCVACNNDRFK